MSTKGSACLRQAINAFVLGAGVLAAGLSQAGPMNLEGQFAVNESGAATYTIPIQVPPGVGGIEPKLALSYNSQSGNGLLGVGWNLSGLSAITRCPRTLAQDGVRGSVNFDSNDRYCLDGQRLIAINGANGADGTEYRTERESYSKIVSYGSAGNGPSWFKVWTKAGQIVEYGNTTDSKIEAIKAAGSTATWPTTTVRAWALNKLSDTKGNYLTYSYTEDAANGDYYPSRIDYTGNSNTGLALSNSLEFMYEVKPVGNSTYFAASRIRSMVLLKEIRVYSGSGFRFYYKTTYISNALLNKSMLDTVQLCVYGNNECVVASSFAWGDLSITWRSQNLPATYAGGSGAGNGGSGIYGGSFITGDFNGDGLTDIAQVDGSWGSIPVCLSTGSGWSCSNLPAT